MALDEHGGSGGYNAATEGGSWRRVAFPVPPLGKLARACGVTSRLGTYAGTGIAGWVATGHTDGETTWATVILAVTVIAADVLRSRKCDCPAPQGKYQ